ncbi:GMC oxidoreductase [Streptomyces sp. NPDC057307]|uniref:GMC oxidoreductase n=1 Tax=Streptomyces sp. NPDC057307 TaxID=3346096 RepID=UPI0036445683
MGGSSSRTTSRLSPGRRLSTWKASAGTYFHPVGTCRIGTDGEAVVDTAPRVHGVDGVDGLSIADASVTPSIVSANTNAAVPGIAERAAHLVATRAARQVPAFGPGSGRGPRRPRHDLRGRRPLHRAVV